MNWKIYITFFVSLLLINFPQNIIGCGGETDPYDYYISFFNRQVAENKNYRPFYYTNSYFLFDADEPTSVSEVLAKEWAEYCGNNVTEKDAYTFVNKYALKDVTNLYYGIEKKTPLKLPDSVKKNSMTNYFINNDDKEALGYIMYAKQVEPLVYQESEWDAPQQDVAKMQKLIKNGNQLYNAAKKEVFKLKYGYQILRLWHYSKDYASTIINYETLIANNKTNSILQPLCLALKAGSLFRTGNNKLAAYLFSKAYAMSPVKKVSNYISFNWAVKRDDDKKDYLAQCKNDNERADMLSLFAISNYKNDIKTVEQIFKLSPVHESLELLATREINKIEERLLTPTLQKQQGLKNIYVDYNDNIDSIMNIAKKDAMALRDLLHNISKHNATNNKAMFETGAAYTSFMLRNYDDAKKYLASAKQMSQTQNVNDQWALTNLLVTINERDKPDANFEEQITPSLQWLLQKAKNDKGYKTNRSWTDVSTWKQFYRNLCNTILAPRYMKLGDKTKQLLLYGAADNVYNNNYVMSDDVDATSFLHTKLSVVDVEKTYSLFTGKQNKFEQFLINNNVIKLNTVTDFAGTANLRESNYTKAIEWFKKAPSKETINKNPFVDLLYDRVEQLPNEKKFATTKLAFAQEMLRLQTLSNTDKNNAAKHLYKMAVGLYNTTYYGHTWQMVQYNRSSSDGYYLPENATAFEKEYYGCYAAHNAFKAAMDASNDKEFKARCLFMMAKCSQKTVQQPQYSNYVTTWEDYDKKFKEYIPTFKNNTYFPEFISKYKGTKFYDEAYASCSYLSDFIDKKK